MFASLAGARVIVTGASKGIGRGIAPRFAEDIVKAGAEAIAVGGDVSTEAGVAAMVAAARAQFGGIDILCARHLSGLEDRRDDRHRVRRGDRRQSAWDLPRGEGLSAGSDENGEGADRRRLLHHRAATGYPGWSHYGASKAGQLGFMRIAAIEFAPLGITINAILPGNIATEGLLSLGPDYVAGMAAAIPMKRLGTVEYEAMCGVGFCERGPGWFLALPRFA